MDGGEILVSHLEGLGVVSRMLEDVVKSCVGADTPSPILFKPGVSPIPPEDGSRRREGASLHPREA